MVIFVVAIKRLKMKKTALLLLMPILLTGIISCSSQDNSQQNWELVWEENFDGDRFDETVWSKIPRGRSDWDRHMSDYDSLYAVENGNLILRGIENNVLPNDTAPYITGGVFTKDKKTFGLGRLEIRAKLNGAIGAWPAFWMLPANAQWPHGGEIDIMERLNYDDLAYQTVHSNYTYHLGIKDNPVPSSTGKINPEDYNTFAVEKYTDSLVFFINDVRTFAYPRVETEETGQYPFTDQEFYLLLDMQLGGKWVGKVDVTTLPVEMYIDWVRFYERRP